MVCFLLKIPNKVTFYTIYTAYFSHHISFSSFLLLLYEDKTYHISCFCVIFADIWCFFFTPYMLPLIYGVVLAILSFFLSFSYLLHIWCLMNTPYISTKWCVNLHKYMSTSIGMKSSHVPISESLMSAFSNAFSRNSL